MSGPNASDYIAGWAFKHPCAWNYNDCTRWFRTVAEDNQLDPDTINLQAFQGITGPSLVQMGSIDFLARDPVYGQLWYNAIRKILDRRE